MLFRFIGSTTKTASQALGPTAVILLAIVLFTGFSIPTSAMLGWCRWINYLSPMAWAFESLMINELNGREFPCSNLVPSGAGYDDESLLSRSCNVIGSTAGSDVVVGTRHLSEAFDYHPSHKWRNFGILLSFMVFFLVCNLITSELVASAKSKGEVLVFRRGKVPATKKGSREGDLEDTKTVHKITQDSTAPANNVAKQDSIFHWRNVCYDVQIKNETRRILDHVDGWVKPGTLTALMVRYIGPTIAAGTDKYYRVSPEPARLRYSTHLPAELLWAS
jgi:ATP-binding cassette, subfamily G (WHITE), member 2, PDR